MNLLCTCCEMTLTRASDLPLVRGRPRSGDLLCVECRWVTPRELRDLPPPSKEWCPTHREGRAEGS